MRAPRRAFPLAPSVLAVLAACTSPEDDTVRVQIAPSLILPHGLLDSVSTIDLVVYEGDGIACDATHGTPTGITSSTTKVADAPLLATGCAGGARFCGSLTISKSDATRLFSATANDSTGKLLASGCTTATVNEDTLSLSIKMLRNVTPSVCGDGVIAGLEQCEGGTDCDTKCQSTEVPLSTAGATVADPFFLWPPQSGEPQGRFFAFYTQTAGGNLDVLLRVLSDTFAPVSSPKAAHDGSLILPNSPNAFPPASMANDQSLAVAAVAGGTYYVAFRDTDKVGPTEPDGPDIHLRSFDTSLSALQTTAIGINGDGQNGEAGIQTAPSIAANVGGALYIAWQDETGPSQGQVLGRKYVPGTGISATQNQISTGTQNRNVKVAATASGFLAVWESGSDIKLRAIDANGTPSGAEQIVNDASLHQGTQDHPSIAALGDGRVCITWADHGASGGADIFVQRYDANLNKVAGDQAVRINNTSNVGDQTLPVVAATDSAKGSFVVAWLDGNGKHIQARLLGGGGDFLANTVNGQTDEFTVSLASAQPTNPTIAIGGAAKTIAIGWQNQSGATGVYARRFPTPQLN